MQLLKGDFNLTKGSRATGLETTVLVHLHLGKKKSNLGILDHVTQSMR